MTRFDELHSEKSVILRNPTDKSSPSEVIKLQEPTYLKTRGVFFFFFWKAIASEYW
jgi:hypothetical protein